jgi:hypothetical protein
MLGGVALDFDDRGQVAGNWDSVGQGQMDISKGQIDEGSMPTLFDPLNSFGKDLVFIECECNTSTSTTTSSDTGPAHLSAFSPQRVA